MSLATWRKEFYPVQANKTRNGKAAILHSIKKWTGLLPKNLKKHGLKKQLGSVTSISNGDGYGPTFSIDGESCALCYHYLNRSRLGFDDEQCSACPLFDALGEVSCDDRPEAPYRVWNRSGAAMPMIRALKKALVMFEKR